MFPLYELLAESIRTHGRRTAVEDCLGAEIDYRDLGLYVDGISDLLLRAGIEAGDRVGICSRKTIGSVASIFAILKVGAAYVPVNAAAPVSRNIEIFDDCGATAVVGHKEPLARLREGSLDSVYSELGKTGDVSVLTRREQTVASREALSPTFTDGIAYILYTSGSTGKPKGVVHSQRSGMSFVDWCSRTFETNKEDRFASHAPFHFDLSILDLFVSLRHGATLVLFDEELGQSPLRLAETIAAKRITSWYSTPTILHMMSRYGRMHEHDYPALKRVLFAGEVYPRKQLDLLNTIWPHPEKYNLYGPTETNVCTYFKLPAELPKDGLESIPIGKACDNARTKVVDHDGREVSRGESGELWVAGDTMMRGYFKDRGRDVACFVTDENQVRWYKTGDIVTETPDGNYIFAGRRDRMVKRRGFRIEPGEIEAAMLRHPEVTDAAAVARPDEESGVRIDVFYCASSHRKISVIHLKVFCGETLPGYMIPDRFHFLSTLPMTSTSKVDYQKLRETV